MMNKKFLLKKQTKTSEDCNKLSKSVSYETLVDGTTTSGREYERTQCLKKGCAKTPLDAVGTLTSQLCCSAKVVEKSLQNPRDLKCKSESERSGKVEGCAGYRFCKTMRFSYENLVDCLSQTLPVFRLVKILSLAVFLSMGMLSESWAVTCTFSNNGKKLVVTGSSPSAQEMFGGCDGAPSNWMDVVEDIELGEGITETSNHFFNSRNSYPNVKTLSMAYVTNMDYDAFFNLENLTTVYAPNLENLPSAVFSNVPNLTEFYAPKLKEIDSDSNLFKNAPKLKNLDFPMLESIDVGNLDKLMSNNVLTLFPEGLILEVNSSSMSIADYLAGKRNDCSISNGYISCGVSEASCYASGQVYWDNACVDEYPFAKKHWTPAEAAEYLKDTDNTIIMTFKVNR